jgi:hypothetical protein
MTRPMAEVVGVGRASRPPRRRRPAPRLSTRDRRARRRVVARVRVAPAPNAPSGGDDGGDSDEVVDRQLR